MSVKTNTNIYVHIPFLAQLLACIVPGHAVLCLALFFERSPYPVKCQLCAARFADLNTVEQTPMNETWVYAR